VAQGGPGRLRSRIFLTFRHYKGGRSSAKRTRRLYPRRNPWYSLSEAESISGHMVLSGVPRKKIPIDTTGNRSWDCKTSTTTLPQAASGKATGPKTERQGRRTCLILTIFMNYIVYFYVDNGS